MSPVEPDPNPTQADAPVRAGVPTDYLKPDEVANYLGVSLKTIRNWTSARFIPFVRKGRVVRYHRPTVDRWLAKGACQGRATIADVRGNG